MIESPLILMLFDILNLVVAALVGGYVFYFYALEPLKAEIQSRIQSLKDLKQHTLDLQQQQKDVENMIADEHEYGHMLLKKIEQWNSVIEQNQTVAQQEIASRKEQIISRMQKQEAILHEHAFNRQVADKLYKKAYDQADTLYQDKKQMDVFLSHIINQLKSE